MPSKYGKIASLPLEIREQLNTRLDRGATPANLAPWLNALPGVQEVASSQFDGNPFSERDISNWRQGGLLEWAGTKDWVALCTACVQDAAKIEAAGFGARPLLLLLTARIAANIQACDEHRDNAYLEMTALQKLISTVLRIHQSELKDARIALDRERSASNPGNRPSHPSASMPPPASAQPVPPASPHPHPLENPVQPTPETRPAAATVTSPLVTNAEAHGTNGGMKMGVYSPLPTSPKAARPLTTQIVPQAGPAILTQQVCWGADAEYDVLADAEACADSKVSLEATLAAAHERFPPSSPAAADQNQTKSR